MVGYEDIICEASWTISMMIALSVLAVFVALSSLLVR